MTPCWVLGSGGLLGSAIVRSLNTSAHQVYVPADRFSWGDGHQVEQQIQAALQAFEQLASEAGCWEIYWAAGVGTMGSTAAELLAETQALGHLLQRVLASARLSQLNGRMAFASSAGAIYAGSRADIIDETCADAPTTPYATAKLEQEHLLREFCAVGGAPVLVARISTLYGPGQAGGKRQGLIAHMARSILRNQPIQIFVPFDTVRDYIAADDAAAAMIESVRQLSADAGCVRKIVASERPTTIAEIVATFRRVARRPPLIATSAGKLSSLYSRRVQFRSVVAPRCEPAHTGLHVGIAQLMAAERLAYAGRHRS